MNVNKKLLSLLSVIILVGCGGAKQQSKYSYVNPEEPQGDYRIGVEANVELDGFANESFYDNEHVYRIDNSNGEASYGEVRFGFANKGLLAFAYVHENRIFENPERYIYHQDSFELYINPGIYKDELRSNCVQFRLSPNLRTETWLGMHSPVDDYSWTYYPVPFRNGTHIDGKVITDKTEEQDPEFANSQGVGYEFYIPYSSFGLDYNPQGLDILPAMVTAHSTGEDDRVWSSYNGVDITDLNNYISVGHRVFKDQGDNIFNTDFTSSGFILDHQLDEAYPYVKNFGYHDQYGYYNAYGKVYYAKARITLYRNLQNDLYPKVGLGSINDIGTSVMLLDPRVNKDNYQALVVDRVGKEDWQWSSAPISWKGDESYENPILFEICRYYDDIYYYMNGQLIFALSAATLGYEDSYPILMTMNYSALFDQCSISEDEQVVLNRIGEVDPYMSKELSTGGFLYDSEDQSYSQNGTYDQYAVFNLESTSYTMSVDIDLGNNLNGDLYPKIGIGEMTGSVIQGYLFDPRPNKDYFKMVHVTGTTQEAKQWSWQEEFWQGEESYDRTINLKVVREDSVSYVYMDNVLAFTLMDNGFENNASHPMFFTMNHSGIFSNITITDNA